MDEYKDMYQDQLNTVKEIDTGRTGEELTEWNQFIDLVSKPKRELIYNFQVTLDNGEIEWFKGYRVQFNNTLGPFKGGLRFDPRVCIDEVKNLAAWMFVKCAILGIEFGGAKGGIKFNPRDPKYTKRDILRISQSFCKALCPDIGDEIDIPAPDVNTNPEIMDYMMSMYQELTGDRHNFATFTGKSLKFNGCPGRTEATGFGVVIGLREYLKTIDPIDDCTYILQGFGNVGKHVAIYMKEFVPHAKLISVGDITGYYDTSDIDVDTILAHYDEHGSLEGLTDKVHKDKDKFFSTKCDIVIPAAMELQITRENMREMDCHIIAEAANGPVTPEADEYLTKNDVVVLPDVLLNAGGVYVSYIEWKNNKNNSSSMAVSAEEVLDDLEKKMVKEFSEVNRIHKEKGISMRKAGFLKGLEEVFYRHSLKYYK